MSYKEYPISYTGPVLVVQNSVPYRNRLLKMILLLLSSLLSSSPAYSQRMLTGPYNIILYSVEVHARCTTTLIHRGQPWFDLKWLWRAPATTAYKNYVCEIFHDLSDEWVSSVDCFCLFRADIIWYLKFFGCFCGEEFLQKRVSF